MSQPEMNDSWRERMELRLEGGGHLPGATEVVAIKHQVSSCSAARRDNLALVQGEIEIYVYYRLFGTEHVRGQGAKVPWYAEVPIPNSVRGANLGAQVIDVKHEHTFNTMDERFTHIMHIVFDVWVLAPGSGDTDRINRPLATRDETPDLLLEQQDPYISRKRGEQPSAKGQRTSSSAKAPGDAEAQLPAWAREAVEEMMRVQQPIGRRPRPARRSMDQTPDGATKPEPKLGSAQGSYTRAGQPYDGPEPEWPITSEFELLDAIPEPEDQSDTKIVDTDTTVIPPPLSNEKEDQPVMHHDTEPVVTNLDAEAVHIDTAPTESTPPQPIETEPEVAESLVEAEPNTTIESAPVPETSKMESSADPIVIAEPLALDTDQTAADIQVQEEPAAPAVTEPEETPPIEVEVQVTTTVSKGEAKETQEKEAPAKVVSKQKEEEDILVWKPFPKTKLT